MQRAPRRSLCIGAALVLWFAAAGMTSPAGASAAPAPPADSTADVPLGDRAYRDLALLGESGLLGPGAPAGGAQPASRYEMALWIAEALDTVHAELFGSPAPHLAPADEVYVRLHGLASELSRLAAVVDEADRTSFINRGDDPTKSQEETLPGEANHGRGALAADLRPIAAHFTALNAEAAAATTPEAFRRIDRRIDTLQQMLESAKEAVAGALPEDVATQLWEKMQPSFQQGIFRRIAERATDFTLKAAPLDSSALLAGKRTQQVEAAAKALSHLVQEFRPEMIALGRWPPLPASALRLEPGPIGKPEQTDARPPTPDQNAHLRSAAAPPLPNVPQSTPLQVLPNPEATPGKSPEAVLSELHVGGAIAEVRASYGGAALDLDALRQIDPAEPPAFGLRGEYSLSSRATVRGGYQVRPTVSGDHLTGLSAQAGAGLEYRLGGGRASLTAGYDVPVSGLAGGGDLLDGTAGIGLRYQVGQDGALLAAYRLIDFTEAGPLQSDLGARLSLRF